MTSSRSKAVGPILLLASVVLLMLGGCSLGARGRPTAQIVRPFPEGCAEFALDERRCAAIVAIARRNLGVANPAAVVELLSAPPPDCGTTPDGQPVICTNGGGGIVVVVRITAPGGAATEWQFGCGIDSDSSIVCTANPTIRLGTPIQGYHDITCQGEDGAGNPTGCATPVPSIAPDAEAAARPLDVRALDVPIDRDGEYEIEVGTVALANGVLQDASFALSRPTLDDIVLEDGVSLTLTPVVAGGRPFLNAYEHGWTEGVEDAVVVLGFVVVWHEPDATLPVRRVVVR